MTRAPSTQEAPDVKGGDADPLLGETIDGRYQVDARIGEGGMGVVYRATHRVLGRRFALKVLRKDMASDQGVVQRFMQEAQAASAIGHENIVDISDFGRLADGAVYFAMEYLDGEDLSDAIQRGGSVPVQDALRMIRQMASALGAAHAQGIVHRDLKPENIFLVRRGDNHHFVKILDFGIAKVGGANSKLTRTGMVFGTPHYMSPEQAAGQSVDQRTDVYSLGVIMYEMFTGRVPFDADTFMGILSKHMFEPPIPPSQVGDRSLGVVEDVILRALAKNPDDRYQTMSQLVEDLDRLSASGTLLFRSARADPSGAHLADDLEPPSRTEMNLSDVVPSAGLPSRHYPVRALLAAAAVAVVVGVAVFALWPDPAPVPADPPPPRPTAAPVAPKRVAAPSPPPATREEPPPARPRVEITTDPEGAQVLVTGAIVGNTPARLPLPETGTRDVEIRLRGYQTETVRLTDTSPETLKITLRPVPERSRRRRSVRPASSAMERTDSPSPSPPSRPIRPPSEVVDPWGT